jgi:parallel beta-helix repeat protein
MTIRKSRSILSGGLAALAVTFAPAVLAKTVYVDANLGADCASTYNPGTRVCGGGTAQAVRTIASGLNAAQAGDIVDVRAGTYRERVIPPRSGTSTAPITLRGHAGETVTVTGASDAALFLQGRSWLIIENLTVTDVTGWARLEDASNNVLRNNRFTNATAEGTTGGIKLVRATGNRIEDNVIEDGNDNLVIQESDRNVIEGNTVREGRHSLFTLRCGNYNIIRGNTFRNTQQKIGEIYDCEGTSDAPVKLDATKRNLVEGNRFQWTLAANEDYRYNGIQYSGQQGIVRRNDFYDNQGGAINFQVYSDEALYNYGHRVYNNTFFNNRCSAVAASGNSTSARYTNNRVTGNLLYRNTNCSGSGGQTNIGNTTAVVFTNNASVTTAPPFVNEANRDLNLQSSSSLIDTGVFVTTASSAGSGTSLPVADVYPFFDGYGIAGEVGDLIRLQNDTRTARIVAIDYSGGRLTLDRSLDWSSGQGVHLSYAGTAPEPGAHEVDGTPSLTPSPPTNLRAD